MSVIRALPVVSCFPFAPLFLETFARFAIIPYHQRATSAAAAAVATLILRHVSF